MPERKKNQYVLPVILFHLPRTNNIDRIRNSFFTMQENNQIPISFFVTQQQPFQKAMQFLKIIGFQGTKTFCAVEYMKFIKIFINFLN